MKHQLTRIKTMAARRGLTEIVAQADKALRIVKSYTGNTYSGARTPSEYTRAQAVADRRMAEASAIMAKLSQDLSWMGAV